MPTILESSQAFDSGDSLWMIPHDPTSIWYQRLNWYTNFKLTANELHSRPKLHPWVLKLLSTCEIANPEIIIKDPLLIPVGQWVPADWLVTIPFLNKDYKHFLNQLQTVWSQFQKPSLRIFLPQTISLAQWESYWNEEGFSMDVTLVVDRPSESNMI